MNIVDFTDEVREVVEATVNSILTDKIRVLAEPVFEKIQSQSNDIIDYKDDIKELESKVAEYEEEEEDREAEAELQRCIDIFNSCEDRKVVC